MNLNWDNIRYLFQVPVEWFRSISTKVFGAYGTNFIRVRDGEDGAMQIDVDEDTFSQAVLEVTGGGSGGGTVKYVDNVPPDANGNVQLGAIRSLNNEYYPDANGNLNVGLGVGSVNNVGPDPQGNVDLGDIVYSVNDIGPDVNGNVNVGTIVHKVNNKNPDSNGNINLGNIVNKVNGKNPDANGNVNVGTVTMVNGVLPVSGNVNLGNLVTGVDGIVSQDFGMLHLNAVRSVNGKTVDANYNVNVGTVMKVNDVSPDENGNVNLNVVTSVNGTSPGADGNVVLNCIYKGDINNASSTQNVCSYLYNTNFYSGNVLGALTDLFVYTGASAHNDLDSYIDFLGYIKEVDLTDYVTSEVLTNTLADYVTSYTFTNTLANYALTDDLGDLAYMDDIEVDGHVSNSHGVVSFGLANNKWLKSNAQGHIVTTDETPVTIDATRTGYVYADEGQLTYKDDTYVTTNTIQDVEETKTFTAAQNFVNGNSSGIDRAVINGSNITLINATPSINLSAGNTTSVIAASHYGGTFTVGTDGQMWVQGNVVNVQGTSGLNLKAPANYATLQNSPNDNATDLAIATVGYLKNKYVDRTTDQTVDGIKTFMKSILLKLNTDREASSRSATELKALQFIDNNSSVFGQLYARAYLNGYNELQLQLEKSNGSAWLKEQLAPNGTSTIHYCASGHTIRHDSDLTHGRIQMTPRNGEIEIFPATDIGNGGFIDFHYAGDSSDYTARIIDYQDNFRFQVPTSKYLRLQASANYAILGSAPTVARTDKTSTAIATCGWVNTNVDTALNNLNLSQYVTQTNLNTTLANYVTTNTNQSISGTKTWHRDNIRNDTIVAAGSIRTYRYNVVDNGDIWGYLGYTSSVGVELNATGGIYLNCPINNAKLANPPNESAADNCIATVGFVKSNEKVKTVDGVYPNENGDVDFQLEPLSVVMTDTNGHLTTGSSGVTANNKKVITGVTWNGTQLVISSENWTLENGLVTEITSNANETINTVTYN